MVALIPELSMIIMVFLASLGIVTIPKDLSMDIVFSPHSEISHADSKYNAGTISEEIKNFGSNNNSKCDDVQIHFCSEHKGCSSPHAKIVCTDTKESTLLVLALDSNKTVVVVTGYKINNGRLQRQILADKCFAVSIGWIKYLFNITH